MFKYISLSGFLILLTIQPIRLQAQEIESVWSPTFSYSIKKSDRIGYNFKTIGFAILNNLDNSSYFDYLETSFAFSYSQSVRLKLGAFYIHRFVTPLIDDGKYEHRLAQQIGYLFFIKDNRISTRFRTEQRFRDSGLVNRWRFRVGYDFPLIGERLDVNEPYVILSNEFLPQFNTTWHGLENRLFLGIGWLLEGKKMFETGLEYRLLNLLLQKSNKHIFVLSTTYHLK